MDRMLKRCEHSRARYAAGLITVCAILLLVGCDQISIAIPMPVIETGDAAMAVPVCPGPFTWSTWWKKMNSSITAGPPELVKTWSATVVPASSVLTITFSPPPQKGTLSVRLWGDGEPKEQTLSGNQLTVPQSAGVYVYDVSAAWRQGTVIYAFKVEVK